jgi:phosphohistidine swiveling domain-containing protein
MSGVTDDEKVQTELDENEQVSVGNTSYGGEEDGYENPSENGSENVSENESDDDDEQDGTDDGERIAIDLSENEVYKGICTLFEDEEGNNILEYISLIHTELIALNKSVDFLRGIKKDLSRIADCAELLTKGKQGAEEGEVKKHRSKKQ